MCTSYDRSESRSLEDLSVNHLLIESNLSLSLPFSFSTALLKRKSVCSKRK